jgi:RimJ/RimL family protein N-acetyltransferase
LEAGAVSVRLHHGGPQGAKPKAEVLTNILAAIRERRASAPSVTKSVAILLETERMYFRQFRVDDAQLLFELDRDPEVMRFITKGHPTPLARIQNEFIPRFLDYYRQSPPRGFWAAHLRAAGEFIGWFHLRPDKISPEDMELGYRLKRSVWGRGLATEGSRALILKAFSEWGYGMVSARTMAIHPASRRVLEKAGLTFESEFHYEVDVVQGWTDEERRAVKYSVTRAQFSRQLQ